MGRRSLQGRRGGVGSCIVDARWDASMASQGGSHCGMNRYAIASQEGFASQSLGSSGCGSSDGSLRDDPHDDQCDTVCSYMEHLIMAPTHRSATGWHGLREHPCTAREQVDKGHLGAPPPRVKDFTYHPGTGGGSAFGSRTVLAERVDCRVRMDVLSSSVRDAVRCAAAIRFCRRTDWARREEEVRGMRWGREERG
jgi:hypothetical protein